ncbi:hypothetical protein WMY93_005475 [Mugilogobius chulae]|uniref:Piezo TM1-24 domain-containing protein n=1 Tax=Mugilogobius chulae TaxID=88201 RepID=A0AAW0PHZ7_9GOBI
MCEWRAWNTKIQPPRGAESEAFYRLGCAGHRRPILERGEWTSIGSPSRCVTAVCVSSLLFLLLQAFFQFTSITLEPDHNCTSWQKALSQLGLIGLSGSDAGSAVRHVAPDLAVLLVGLLTWRLSSRLGPAAQDQDQDRDRDRDSALEPLDTSSGPEESPNRVWAELESLLRQIKDVAANMTSTGGQVLLTALLGLTGIVFPSLSSLPYLLCFQVLCSWWAWSGRVSSLLIGYVSVMSLLYSACHFLLFYCCQLPTLQDTVMNSSTASVFGVVPLEEQALERGHEQQQRQCGGGGACGGEEPVEGEEPLDDSVFELSAETKRALWSRTHQQTWAGAGPGPRHGAGPGPGPRPGPRHGAGLDLDLDIGLGLDLDLDMGLDLDLDLDLDMGLGLDLDLDIGLGLDLDLDMGLDLDLDLDLDMGLGLDLDLDMGLGLDLDLDMGLGLDLDLDMGLGLDLNLDLDLDLGLGWTWTWT